MLRQKIVFFLPLFLVCFISSRLFSQIAASATTGCVPFQVSFTPPPGAISGSWNLGNGTSTQLNPNNLYYNPGTYNISFSGLGPGGSPLSGNITILVVANNIVPSINFTIPPNHCAPMTVPFSGSASGGGTQYQWTFGDGAVAQGNNVSHPYTLGGIFNATLSVTNPATGCVGTATAGPFNVSTPPVVIIDANPGLNSCVAPFTTAFSGSNSATGSPLGSALTYSWSFSGGQPASSNVITPGNVTFNNQGTHNVSLLVTDNNNCSNSNTVVVTMVQPTISATGPGTICVLGQQTVASCAAPCFYVNYSSNLPNINVQMDDGNTFMVSQAAGVFNYPLYTTPGPKTITLTATVGNCSASTVITVFVEKIVPEYTFTPASFTCSPTMAVSFINQTTVNSGSSLSYTWDVEHWNKSPSSSYTSTAVHPNFVIEQHSANPYTMFGVYTPAVKLLVMSSTGCIAMRDLHRYDSIRRPTAWFNKDKKQGCAPLTVRFRDSSNTNVAIFPIQSYTWNNGANPATIVVGNSPPAVNNPTFTYASPGTYTPFLIIATAGGCVDTSFVDTVIVVNPPTVNVFIPNLQVCAGQTLQVNMSAAPSSSVIQHWHAQSSDGLFSGCINNPSPAWYFLNPGPRTFTVSAYNHSCRSDAVASQTVTVLGPMVKGRFRTSCVNRDLVKFISDLRSTESATLNFGDGSPVHTIAGNAGGRVIDSVAHVYAATGNYTATLTGINSITGCGPFTHTMLVTVRNVQASLTVQPVICRGGTVTYSALGSVDVYTTCGRGFAWFLDSLPIVQTGSPLLTTCTQTDDPLCLFAPGIHTLTLWVRDINSCTDTVTRTFILDTPQPSFSVAANPVCFANMPVQFVNTTSQIPVAANTFTWDFGTGIPTTTTTPVSNWPTYAYPAVTPSQTYIVALTSISDLNKCRETFTMALQVNKPPQPTLYAYTPLACAGNIVNFNANVPAAAAGTAAVYYGDGAAPFILPFSSGVVAHTYTAPGIYTPTISFTDPVGCATSFTQQVSVQEAPVTPDFIFYSSDIPPSFGPAFCAPELITFSNTTSSSYSLNFGWNLGTGSPIVDNPVVANNYDNAGVQTVALTVSTSPNGCSATVIHTLVVLNPTASITVDKNSFCLGESITVKIKDSTQVNGWQWYYGDGVPTPTIMATASPPTQTVYPYTTYPLPFGSAVVSLFYFATSSGIACTNAATLGIQVTKVDADFRRNDEMAKQDSVHCLNLQDVFTNKSMINNSSSIGALSFNWNMGNGVTSTSMSPGYTYPQAGVYTITLTVTDPQFGCKDVAVKNMTIHPLPTVGISIPDSICSGTSYSLVSTSSADVVHYQWLPWAGVVSPNAANTAVTSTASTTFSLNVTSVNGCSATSNSEYVYIQPPVPVIQWDTTIVIGQQAGMSINVGPGYTYTWSPLTDLSCEHCPYPVSTTTNNITYTVEVEDPMGCFRTINTYSVIVDPITSIDVPTAFTPNGDGVNDVIYVDGWGIRKLNYFRIFNRWGQLLFESNDIKIGWNGIYEGVPQNMETYVYQVSAEGYVEGSHMEKTSSFRLIR